MKRREFCKTSTALAAGLAVPAILKGADSAPHGVVGHGDFKYKKVHNWGVLGSSTPVKDCHEMVQDSQGRLIMITNETKNNIIIYNKDGKLIETWGHEFPGGHGLTLADENGEEFLFITDPEKNQVYKTTLDGKILMTIDTPLETGKYTEKAQFKPTEVALTPNGDFYVADGYGQQFITHYDSKGQIKNIFGGRGEGDEYFDNCHGICFDNRNGKEELLITARVQNAFKRFSLDGQHLETIPLPGAYVCRPVIAGDHLYFAVLISKLPWDSKSGFVTILDEQNNVVSNPGGSNPETTGSEDEPYQQVVELFQHPHDVCIDDDENIYVPQWNSGRTYPIKLERV